MNPVLQTQFGSDFRDIGSVGNCMAACVASILELNLADVPNFMAAGDLWFAVMQSWLSQFGLAYIEIALVDGAKATIHVEPGIYYIMIGKSPRGRFLHAVVYCNHELAHDPHPSGAGLDSSEILGFFVPMNPQSMKGHTPMNHEGYRGLSEKLKALKEQVQDPQVKEQLTLCADWASTLVNDLDQAQSEVERRQKSIEQANKTLGMIQHLVQLQQK